MLKIYGRPDGYTPKCHQCEAVKKWLDRNEIEYDYLDVDDHIDYLEGLGIRALPIVVTKEGMKFGGFDIGKLQKIKAGT